MWWSNVSCMSRFWKQATASCPLLPSSWRVSHGCPIFSKGRYSARTRTEHQNVKKDAHMGVKDGMQMVEWVASRKGGTWSSLLSPPGVLCMRKNSRPFLPGNRSQRWKQKQTYFLSWCSRLLVCADTLADWGVECVFLFFPFCYCLLHIVSITPNKVLVFWKGRLCHCAIKKKPFLCVFSWVIFQISDILYQQTAAITSFFLGSPLAEWRWFSLLCSVSIISCCNPISHNAITIESRAICRTLSSPMCNSCMMSAI